MQILIRSALLPSAASFYRRTLASPRRPRTSWIFLSLHSQCARFANICVGRALLPFRCRN